MAQVHHQPPQHPLSEPAYPGIRSYGTPDQLYSYSDANTWRYGDEASLYSIAEDSREDRASVSMGVPSVVGAEAPTPAHLEHDTKIEVQWRTPTSAASDCTDEDAEDDLEFAPPPANSTGNAIGEESNNIFMVPCHKSSSGYSRKCRLIAVVVLVVVAVIAIAVGITVSNNNKGAAAPASTSSDGSQQQSENVGGGNGNDTGDSSSPDNNEGGDDGSAEDTTGSDNENATGESSPGEDVVDVDSNDFQPEEDTEEVPPAEEEEEEEEAETTTEVDEWGTVIDYAGDDPEDAFGTPIDGGDATAGEAVDNEEQDPDTVVEDEPVVEEEEENQAEEDPVVVAAPEEEDVGSETSTKRNPALILVTNFVMAALSTCADEGVLEDTGTVENSVFRRLIDEVIDASTVKANGFYNIPLEIGFDMLAERYAMMMLYERTGGQQWITDTNWMSSSFDVCDWFGVDTCAPRSEGSCAVTSLTLGKL